MTNPENIGSIIDRSEMVPVVVDFIFNEIPKMVAQGATGTLIAEELLDRIEAELPPVKTSSVAIPPYQS